MLTVYSNPLELRGVAHKVSKNNKSYYVINCESDDGSPHAFYCPDASALAQGLKKGDMVCVTFDVAYFKGNERLVVTKVVKVDQ